MFANSSVLTHVNPGLGKLKFLSLAAIASLAFISFSASAQDFNKSFRVLPDASALEVINKMGSVTVVQGDVSTITITASRNGANINTSPLPQGGVKLEVTSDTPVDFKITVPASSMLNLLCIKCAGGIIVKGIRGMIQARTTEGNIQITGTRSPLVEASSTGGDVHFDGEILASGSYTLKSFSGRVQAFLPASASFKLNATSFRGGMDLKDFSMNYEKQSDRMVHAFVGSAKATVNLWTQEGSIVLRRRN